MLCHLIVKTLNFVYTLRIFTKTILTRFPMNNFIVEKRYSLIAIIAVIFLCVSAPVIQAQSQNESQVANNKYVRVDIGHGALHCPFLSPKLETQLKELKGITNFFMDRQNSFATFNLPADTEITVEELKKIGVDVGYPSTDVMVAMDNKPIKTATKPQ